MNVHDLPWAGPFQRRCLARRADGVRCELRRGHDEAVLHAYDYGMDTPRWSDAYVAAGPVPSLGAATIGPAGD